MHARLRTDIHVQWCTCTCPPDCFCIARTRLHMQKCPERTVLHGGHNCIWHRHWVAGSLKRPRVNRGWSPRHTVLFPELHCHPRACLDSLINPAHIYPEPSSGETKPLSKEPNIMYPVHSACRPSSRPVFVCFVFKFFEKQETSLGIKEK